MTLESGRHAIGPADGSLQVLTFREGVASRAGHDLVIDVAEWSGAVDVAPDGTIAAVELTAEPGSLQVREGRGGVKPLSEKDKNDIRGTIAAKVLRGRPIAFRSTVARLEDGRLDVEGELTLHGAAGPVAASLQVEPDGRVHGTIPVRQSAWGISPYRGLMGALKVRDDVEVALDVRLPAA